MLELGQFRPQRVACEQLQAGQVGYLICNIKSLAQVHIGDTVTRHRRSDGRAARPVTSMPQRMVFCGLYPSDGQDFEELREALEKLIINDPSFEFEPETSDALGFGFRCGFLGLLHMEIIQQRLEQESDLDLVQTAPNVTYEVVLKTGEVQHIYSPERMPDLGLIEEIRAAGGEGELHPAERIDRSRDAALLGPPRRLRANGVPIADASHPDV